MDQPKTQLIDARIHSTAYLNGSNPVAVEMSGKRQSTEGSENSTELHRSDSVKTTPFQRRQSTNRTVNSHRRYKSYPAYSHMPNTYSLPATTGRVPHTTQDQEEGQFPQHHQLPIYHPWVAGFDIQWSAYGMYVLSTVMSKRSEKPTRIIFIGNLAPSVEEKRVIEVATKYGPIRGIDSSLREYWFGMFVSYWDTRHAEEAVRGLPEHLPGAGTDELHQQIPVTVCFMMPPGIPGMENQGQLTVKIENGTTSTEIRKLFANFGEVKTVRSLTEDSKCVEFYDARAAEAALRQIKTPNFSDAVLDVEYSKLPTPSEPNSVYTSPSSSPKGEDPVTSEGDVDKQWPWPPASYLPPWGQYSLPPQRPLLRQNSAPAAQYTEQHGVYPVPRPDAVWTGHYTTYPTPPPPAPHHGMQHWGYNGGHQNQQIPVTVQVNGRYEGIGSHGHRMETHPGSPGSESQNWRPHRTRSTGERVYDPAQFQFNLAEVKSDPAAARTTLMIRNIPNKYSQKMLLEVLNKRYSGRFDFFYLPIDFKNRCNLGYAFVNFVDAGTTVEFYKEFHTKSWEEFNSKKVCEITYARVQGRESLIEHFRNSRFPCNDPDYLPLVFEIEEEGKRVKTKGTPVHHSASSSNADYTETTHSAVAAH
eukprot:g512.t1